MGLPKGPVFIPAEQLSKQIAWNELRIDMSLLAWLFPRCFDVVAVPKFAQRIRLGSCRTSSPMKTAIGAQPAGSVRKWAAYRSGRRTRYGETDDLGERHHSTVAESSDAKAD